MENSNKVFSFTEIGESIKKSKPIKFKKVREKKVIEFFKNENLSSKFNAISIYKEFSNAKESITYKDHVCHPRGFNSSLELKH